MESRVCIMLENKKCGVSAELAADVGDSERYKGGELEASVGNSLSENENWKASSNRQLNHIFKANQNKR